MKKRIINVLFLLGVILFMSGFSSGVFYYDIYKEEIRHYQMDTSNNKVSSLDSQPLSSGATWSHPIVINDTSGGSDTPKISVDNKNNIHVVWEDTTDLGGSGGDSDIFYANYSVVSGKWSNVKVISNNIGVSNEPSIVVDSYGNIHVVWQDNTNLDGCGGKDFDIFYANYSATLGMWSDEIVISDNNDGMINWNTGDSFMPQIAVDSDDNLHVVWEDKTNLEGCGTDREIFYANYSVTSSKWSYAKVISDNINGTINWNTGASCMPDIAVDKSDNLHVVWYDYTNLEGSGSDSDIFYVNYSVGTGNWSHAKVINDNDGDCEEPIMIIDSNNNIHVVWSDETDLEGCGSDSDIFYVKHSSALGEWLDTEVISDNINGTANWNTGYSILPDIGIDQNDNIHVVWEDGTNLEGCDTDGEIFYASYNNALEQWSHTMVISDNINGTINWNTGYSSLPAIAVDKINNIHIVWRDNTNIEGSGTDPDIFYVKCTISKIQTVPDGDNDDDNDESSESSISYGWYYIPIVITGIISLIFYIKKKLVIE